MDKEVSHIGHIKSIDSNGVTVSIESVSGCGSCSLKGACNMSEKKDKEISVTCDTASFSVGDAVEVFLKESLGFRALFLSYILPLLVLVLTMVITSSLTSDEGVIGLASIGSLIPYYSVLFAFRKYIQKDFNYRIKSVNQ